ncbi:MAG: ABC transporter ATP-binding protein [Alphaproteobacteria bacterium]|nr:MAG: ABC transporter ATP-binding protein [Alphaproteobacteria bacterium]
MPDTENLLETKNLRVEYAASRGLFSRNRKPIRILDGFNLQIRRGETLAIVGESGCGKTTLANCIARFIPATSGQVLFDGKDVLGLHGAELKAYRRNMQMVFQNPFSSLNPRLQVSAILAEPLKTHTDLDRNARSAKSRELLAETGLPEAFLDRHPHELSGGQAQRVALARALALNPRLLLLDEPTSALDVSVQAQILNLLQRLQTDYRLTYMLISHSLGVVQHISDRIAVLYLGEVVELAPRRSIFSAPRHPYTQALVASTPVPDPRQRRRYVALQGMVPSAINPPSGCRFHTRCPHVMSICRSLAPQMRRIDDGHFAACHLLDDSQEQGQGSAA